MSTPKDPSAGTAAPESARMRELLKEATLEIRRLRARLEDAQQAPAVTPTEAIAIVGMGCRFPGGVRSPDDYWALLRDGVDAIGDIPPRSWNADQHYDADPLHAGTMYVRQGGFIDGVEDFDPQFFGISPREAEAMDPQQRLLLEVTHDALEHAGLPAAGLRGSATGVFVGLCFDDYTTRNVRSGDPARIDAHGALGTNRAIAAGRIAYAFDFHGPVMQLDTTCSSSLLALHLACRSLRDGEADLALAGGVNLMLSPEASIGFSRLNALSPDGRCRTFDASARGYARGEGCGMLVLKRLSDALTAGDTVHAVVRASAVNHDGASNGLTAPSGPAQTAVIRAALAAGGLQPDDVQYVEAHGTATPLGDPIEVMALADALGARREPLYIGSVKTNFGHLESAAGAAGLMKAVLALRHGRIPPHLHFVSPSPHVPWARLPLRVPVALTDWPHTAGPRRAGISSFGMSGTNVHVIVEQAEAAADHATALAPRALQLLPLSARSEAALRGQIVAFSQRLAQSDATLAELCASATSTRSHFPHRRAFVAGDIEAMRAALSAAPRDRLPSAGRAAPRIAFLYTGQGAQYVGMGRVLYENEAVFRAAVDQCAAVLDTLLPQPLVAMLFGDDAAALDRTINTQPALFALQYALTELWRSWGIWPRVVLGHSVGEYAAAVQAGVMPLQQALRLLAVRARLMHELPSDGAMAAVRAGRDPVAVQLARIALPGVEIAASNGPANTVIAGPRAQLVRVVEALAQAGVHCTPLAVSQAFHSALMEPMLGAFTGHAAAVDFALPQCTYLSSMTGREEREALVRPSYWVEQIRRPVEFAAALDALAAQDCDVCIEIGPQPVLLTLGQTSPGAEGRRWLPSLRRPDGPDSDGHCMLQALAALYEAGAEPDWNAFLAGRRTRRVALPTYPFQRRRCWQDAGAVTVRPAAAAGWPGRSLPLAGDRLRVFETTLNEDGPVRWPDHAVMGATLFPAAGYLCLAQAAAGMPRARVSGLALLRGLWLDGEVGLQTQSLQDGDGWRLEFRDMANGALNATARVGAAATAVSDDTDPHAIAHRLARSHARDDFYDAYAARGIVYGDAFRLLDDIRVGTHEAIARVLQPGPAAATGTADVAVVDAGLQLAGALLAGREGTWLPGAVDAFEWPGAEGALWVHVQVRAADAAADPLFDPLFDLRWLNGQGVVAGRLDGLKLVALAARKASTPAAPALYEIVWRDAGLPHLPSAGALRRAAQPRLDALAADVDVLDYQRLQPRLEALSAAYASAALSRLGIARPDADTAHDAVAFAAWVVRQGIAADRVQLFRRVLAMATPSAADIPALRARSEAECPRSSTEIELLCRCGDALDTVLAGRTDPLQILFPGGDLSLLTALYESSPGALAMNALLRDALLLMTGDWSAASGRPLRVLEIGAGTGGSSAHLLPALAGLAGPVEYRYTDVSQHFLNQARERFAAFGFVEYALLDIEQAPGADLSGSFDIVVAANVLHATADLGRTLSHVHALLAPGGRLLLLEATQPLRWLDLVFGMMPGWWAFTDHERRPAHPLLDDAGWQAALAQAGFDEACALQPAQALAQSVIVAARGGGGRRWRVAGDATSARRIADALRAGGDAADHDDALDAADGIDGVVIALPESVEGDDAGAAAAALCAALPARVRALAQWPQPPRLVFAATGSQDDEAALVASPLWGVVQTVQFEYPQLQPRLLYVDAPSALADELRRGDAEPHVRLRGGERRVARLRPLPDAGARRLQPDGGGSIAGLHWQSFTTAAPTAGEVTVRVQASGLNFRDVLIAMGQYPEAATMGAECSGVVSAVGAGVTAFAVGDHVMAIGAGCLASEVRVDARLVSALPQGVDAIEAATLPVAYATAALGLIDLARLQPGERVLIHTATGGVGQAAIRIARDIGAEVFATAGGDKRGALRAMGIDHVMDSRTPAFADDILRRTHGQGVDVVIGALPGELQIASLDALGGSGRFVEIGKGAGLSDAQFRARAPGVQVFRVDLAAMSRDEPARVGALLDRVREQVEAGRWQPLPHTCHPRGEAVDAFRRMQQARHTGKLLLVDDGLVAGTGAAPVFRADASYLITGGFGALGRLVAGWMAARGARHLHLLGRTADAADLRLDALRAAGVNITAHAADVADADALQAVFARIDATPAPLRGIVHAAGVLDDVLLAQMDTDAMARVLAPKVRGGWHLHALSTARELDFFMLFSSAAGVIGAPGQANHAAANAFLDGLARHRRALGLPAQAIAWGAWSDVGSALKYQRDDGSVSGLPGVGVIEPDAGVALFDRLWQARPASVAVLPVDWATFLAQPRMCGIRLFEGLGGAGARTETASVVTASVREELLALDAGARAQQLDDYVCEAIARTLGLTPAELDRQAGFFDLGMDSLTALELKNRLQTALGVALPATLIFDYPTTDALLGHLQLQFAGADEGATATPVRAPAAVVRDVMPAPADTVLPEGADLKQALDDRLNALDALFGDEGGATAPRGGRHD